MHKYCVGEESRVPIVHTYDNHWASSNEIGVGDGGTNSGIMYCFRWIKSWCDALPQTLFMFKSDNQWNSHMTG
jgi:hypothetical protein